MYDQESDSRRGKCIVEMIKNIRFFIFPFLIRVRGSSMKSLIRKLSQTEVTAFRKLNGTNPFNWKGSGLRGDPLYPEVFNLLRISLFFPNTPTTKYM